MKNLIGYLAALSLVSLPLAAQERGHEEGHSQPQGGHSEGHNEGPRANAPVGHGYIPSRGPAPTRSAAPVVNRAPVAQGQPDPQHHAYRDQQSHPEIPHVHPQRDQWVGHNTGPPTFATTSISRGRTAASPAGSARATSIG